MTNIIQYKLKYIFSNNNILLDSLKFCKKNNIGDSQLNILNFPLINFLPEGIFQKVLSSSNVLTVLLHICSLLPVSLSYVLLVVTSILGHGLKIFKNIFSILSTAMSFLLSLKNVESSSFMTDLFCQNFLPLLIRYSSSSFTISAEKEKEKTKFLNIPNITLLIPILYIMVSFLSFILLAET